VSSTALAGFARARDAALRDKARVTRVLQAIISRRWLADATSHVLARRPALLDTLMGVIGDFVPPAPSSHRCSLRFYGSRSATGMRAAGAASGVTISLPPITITSL